MSRYTLDDLKGDYVHRPRYISFDEQQRLLKVGSESDKEFRNLVASKFADRAQFNTVTSSLFKPITDVQKETSKNIIQNQEVNSNAVNKVLEQKLEDQNKIIKESIEYKNPQHKAPDDSKFKEIQDTGDMVTKYLTNANRDLLFGVAEFKDDSVQFGCVEDIQEHGFLVSQHKFILDYEDKKISIIRSDVGEKRDYALTENIIRYLTLDVVDIADENANKIYLEMISYAIGPELGAIKRAGKSEKRRLILNKFRLNNKFKELIAPKFGIKKLGYSDDDLPGDGLGHTRKIIIPSNPSSQMKRIMVLLGTKKSLGDKNNYNIGLEEFSAVLDELLKSNTINKMTYKTFLQKYYKA